MAYGESTRRLFLKQAGLGFGGILLNSMLPETIFAAHQRAKSAGVNAEKFTFFTDAEAADLKAFAAQVIPAAVDSPGASEANVVYFIDHVVTTFQAESKPRYREALVLLTNFTTKLYPSAPSFAALENEQQSAVMTAFHKEMGECPIPAFPFPLLDVVPSFELLRQAVVAGFLSDPVHGGNKKSVGWQWIGFDAEDVHESPFGYYDAELSKPSPGGGQ